MKILYTTKNQHHNEITQHLSKMPDWDVILTETNNDILAMCSRDYYDVLVIDSNLLNDANTIMGIKEIRDRQIFTPILVITDTNKENSQTLGLAEGADMCIEYPFDIKEMILRIRVLKRRNLNYQSPVIEYNGIILHRPDGKIRYGDTSLSVSPIEIELFRLLTRASSPVHVKILADKMNETEDKIIFAAKCLKKKIHLLNCDIKLEYKGSKCILCKQSN